MTIDGRDATNSIRKGNSNGGVGKTTRETARTRMSEVKIDGEGDGRARETNGAERARMTRTTTDGLRTRGRRNRDGCPSDSSTISALKNKQSASKASRVRMNDTGDRVRVLVVEDDDDTRSMVDSMLQSLGVDVVHARDGAAALEALKRCDEARIDMILADILVPEVDGEELLEAVRANDKLSGVPIVIMSTVDEQHAKGKRIEGAGATDFLTKPLSRSMLKESLERTARGTTTTSNDSESVDAKGADQTEKESPANDGSGADGSAKSSLTKMISDENKTGGGSGGSVPRQNDSGSGNQYDEKLLTRRSEAEAMDRWASREGGSGDCGSDDSAPRTGSGSGSHEGSGSGRRDPNDSTNFRGLSVQLVKAHGGATTMLELSLPETSAENVTVRRSNSRSAFQGFQHFLKTNVKQAPVHMMSIDLSQQQQSFYEASSIDGMPAADYMNFFGTAALGPSQSAPLDAQQYVQMSYRAAHHAVAHVNPFYTVLQSAAEHVQQTTSDQAAEHRAAAIRRFLKKRKERNFNKKVRYESRQKLAASRPRVRGQFMSNTDKVAAAAEKKRPTGEGRRGKHNKEFRDSEYCHGSNEGSGEDSKEDSKDGSRSSSRQEGQGSGE